VITTSSSDFWLMLGRPIEWTVSLFFSPPAARGNSRGICASSEITRSHSLTYSLVKNVCLVPWEILYRSIGDPPCWIVASWLCETSKQPPHWIYLSIYLICQPYPEYHQLSGYPSIESAPRTIGVVHLPRPSCLFLYISPPHTPGFPSSSDIT
jgi:hypothetical protein